MKVQMGMTLPLVWENPPPAKTGTGGYTSWRLPWPHIVAVLRDHPGRWARLTDDDMSVASGWQTAHRHGLEAVIRGGLLYVRWPEEENDNG